MSRVQFTVLLYRVLHSSLTAEQTNIAVGLRRPSALQLGSRVTMAGTVLATPVTLRRREATTPPGRARNIASHSLYHC